VVFFSWIAFAPPSCKPEAVLEEISFFLPFLLFFSPSLRLLIAVHSRKTQRAGGFATPFFLPLSACLHFLFFPRNTFLRMRAHLRHSWPFLKGLAFSLVFPLFILVRNGRPSTPRVFFAFGAAFTRVEIGSRFYQFSPRCTPPPPHLSPFPLCFFPVDPSSRALDQRSCTWFQGNFFCFFFFFPLLEGKMRRPFPLTPLFFLQNGVPSQPKLPPWAKQNEVSQTFFFWVLMYPFFFSLFPPQFP